MGKKSLFIVFLIIIISYVAQAQVQMGTSDLIKIDYASPRDYEIGGITVSGIQYLDNNVIILLSGLNVGDQIKIPGDDIPDAIKKLWEQGLFENIKISVVGRQGSRLFLNFDLTERPRLSTFSFKGIKRTEADNLREEINLMSGDVVTNHMVNRTQQIIADHYESKGYFDAEIKVIQVADTARANSVKLVIDIKKNKKVKIYQININGNENLSAKRIKGVFKETKEKGLFRPFYQVEQLLFDVVKNVLRFDLEEIVRVADDYAANNIKIRIFKSSKYIEDLFEEDKIKLIQKYNELGFRDATILSDSIYRNEDNTISINLDVEEGPRYYFRNIFWVGNTKYTAEELGRFLKIEKGDVYNREMLETNLTFNPAGTDVSSLYLDDGYLFFTATPVEVAVENDSIDIEIRIREGKQATLNNITVSGNTRTNDHVVMREIRTKPGQLFRRSDVIRTVRELAQLRYFNPETINPAVNPDPASSTVDIEYQVEETSADQIELSGGWGYGRIIGTLGLSFNNFSVKNIFNRKAWKPIPTGDGQKLSLRLQTYGKGYFSYSASFTEPWLGGKKPNAFSVSFFHSLYSNGLPRGDTLRSSFKINGLTFGLGKRLTWPDDFFTLYQGISFQRYDLLNYSTIFVFGTGNGYYNNISYNITFARNSISAPIYPRYGSEVSISLELTPPYSLFNGQDYSTKSDDEKYRWIEYHKWKFNAAWYFELADKLVLSARTKFGFLGMYNSDIGITPFDRFYLGGDGLSGYNNFDGREIIGMRGYANETVTPLYYQNKNIGGTIFSKYTLEVRYPLSLNPNATIYGAAFFEAGNSWLNFDNFDPFDVRRAAGVGMRVFLPMFGVLGLDWAYGFDVIPGIPSANGSQFHFSINQSID